jgi:hypothetical protein
MMAARWLMSDDPGWFLAVIASFSAAYLGRTVDAIGGKFCIIFVSILLIGGLLMPASLNFPVPTQ